MSWFGSLLGGSLGGLLGKASSALSNPVVNTVAHLTGAGLLTDTINGANAIKNALGGSSGYSNLEKLAILNAANQNNSSTSVSTTQAEDKAAQDSIDTAESEARANTTSAINNGVNKSKAGMLGEAGANNALTSTYNDRYNEYKSGAASSQADYLRSMGQTYDQVNQLNNAKKGQKAAINSGMLSGAAQGMGLGMSLSDENAKCATSLDEMVERFKALKSKVDALKTKEKQ